MICAALIIVVVTSFPRKRESSWRGRSCSNLISCASGILTQVEADDASPLLFLLFPLSPYATGESREWGQEFPSHQPCQRLTTSSSSSNLFYAVPSSVKGRVCSLSVCRFHHPTDITHCVLCAWEFEQGSSFRGPKKSNVCRCQMRYLTFIQRERKDGEWEPKWVVCKG